MKGLSKHEGIIDNVLGRQLPRALDQLALVRKRLQSGPLGSPMPTARTSCGHRLSEWQVVRHVVSVHDAAMVTIDCQASKALAGMAPAFVRCG
jgi:hypothetical protein